ncbi:hypothetical protein C8Q77DRAFT_1050048 [Trametes polyzona]|nr:hypothetical protein C8Q77DRAFT_1050048 [Trametes polyzona]
MQDLLMNSYLAYKAGRSFVFANYTWIDDGSLYSEFKGKKIPSQIPFTALIRGPIVGEPFPGGIRAPLSVSRDYYEKLCPQKVNIHREEIRPHDQVNAQSITDAWAARINELKDEPCVEAGKDVGQIYTYDVFGGPKAMLDIWPHLARSPILTHFGWSPLVEMAFDTNREYFFSSPVWEPYLINTPYTTNADRYGLISGLMAIHVRRGDYEEHCKNLANWGSSYVAFNSFPGLPDHFEPPQRGEGEAEAARVREVVRPHCWPHVEEIVKRVREVRGTPAAKGVHKLYIMTNGDTEYLRVLTGALARDMHWTSIATSRDMVLNVEQKYVSQAVDMLVGQRAQVLIGNGFSTLTSNVVTMRLANRFRHDSIRFW